MKFTIAKLEMYSGLLLLLVSLYIALLPHYSFFLIMILGWFFLVDSLNFRYFKRSFLTLSLKEVFLIFVVGGGLLYGGVLESGNILSSELWNYNQVDVLPLFLAHMLTLPTAVLTFRLVSAFLNVREKKKEKVYHNKYIPLVIGLFLISLGLLVNGNKVLTYAFLMVGYVFLIEFGVLLRKRTTFFEKLITNPKLFIPIVVQALLSSLLVEGANNLAGAWTYHVLNYQLYGLYPLIMIGWIPLIIGLLSLFELVK